MRNRVRGGIWNLNQQSFVFALVLGLLALTLTSHALGQSSKKKTHAKHAASSATVQPGLVQTPTPADMPFLHIVPYGTPTKLKTPPASSAGGTFSYWGGPLISNVHVVEVLWGSFVDVPSTTGLPQFLTDVTNSNYFDLLSEYGTVGVQGQGGAPGSNQLIGRGVFDGKFGIAPSICPGSSANPPPACSLTDTQIQAELQRQLSHLPAPVTDKQGNYNTIYLFYFPPGVQIFAGAPSCAPGGFCAYHSSIAGGLPAEIPYGVFPDFGPTSGCSAAGGHCGRSTSANNLSSATSHEIGEAVTDVNVGNVNALAPPLAWYDPNRDSNGHPIGEIGDICNQDQQQITVGTHNYTVQALYSNMQNNCVIAPAQLILSAPAAGAIPGQAFNLTTAVYQSPQFSGILTNYSNTIHFTSSDAQAVLPADYTFVPATDNGSHTFSITLNTIGSQTITATDTLAAPITGTATLNVSHNPDMTLAITHTGNFSQGQTGAHYTLTASNVGDIPSSGTVTVADSLSPDFTATAMSGTGWTCTVATFTCTRSDALAPNASYPNITLTVNVSNTAPPVFINTATVAGGGEVNLLNDLAGDRTVITQFADLVPFIGDSGNFSQGQTGAQYLVTVQNASFAPTTAPIGLTATLGTGLTATAITGANWNCVLATLHCSRSDVLGGQSTFEVIQITVNVALNAPSTVTTTAVVSGGGEIITSNDTATDITAVSGPVPDFIIASAHTGSFSQGQTGATFRVTASNTGVAASAGLVTVTDFPDSNLTPTAISGTGWACTLSPLSCNRSDALAPASSYPPIAVTVNVSSSAPASLANTVNVSGGGELNTSNDSATDVVNIIQVPDMTGTSFHSGNFGQSQIGATYTLTATNSGGAVSVGTITLTDTLPTGLTATAMSGTGWTCTLATLTCTSSTQLSSNASSQVALTVNVAANAPSSVTNTVTVSGGGEVNTTNDTGTDVTQIQPAVSLTVSNASGPVTAGQSAFYGLSVVSFAPNPAVLSCSGLPALAACSFSPPSVTGQTNTNLTITTVMPIRSAQFTKRNGAFPVYAVLLPLLGLFLTLRKGRTGIGKGKTRLSASAALLTLIFLVGCGGGSSTPPTLHGGTPAGTYTVTVTATDGASSLQGSTTVQLIVNWNGL
jgi:hypothetical protein